MPDEVSQTRDLLQRWHAGDRDALNTLLERDLDWIRQKVHQQLGGKLRRAGDTGDFVQEAVLVLLRDGPRFLLSDRGQFRALLAKITANVLCSQARRLDTLKRDAQRQQPLPSDTVLHLDGPQRNVTQPDEKAALAEEKAWLRLAVGLLEPGDQEVTELHWQGLTDPEIGARLDITANTARMRRSRAAGRLGMTVRKLKSGQLAEILAD